MKNHGAVRLSVAAMFTIVFAAHTPALLQAQSKPLVKVIAGYGSTDGAIAPLWFAKETKLFEKRGLDVRLVGMGTGSVSLRALIAHDLEIASLSGSGLVQAALQGADTVLLSAAIDGFVFKIFGAAEISSPAQLKGKKLGVSRFGSAADFGLRVMLRRLGLDPAKDVAILQVGDEPARSAALQAGNIDGTVMNAPFGAQAEKLRLNVLADSVKMGIPFFGTGMLGSRRVLDREEAKVLNLMRAYLEAIKVLKSERGWSVQALSQFTRVTDKKLIEEAYDSFKDQLPNVPYPPLEAMQAVIAQMAETTPKARQIDARNYISDRYLRQLENEGFVKRLWQK